MDNKNFLANSQVGEWHKGYARVLIKRKMGKISFWTVRFKESTGQFILTDGRLSNYREILKIPVGSLVEVEGRKVVTKSGTPSLEVIKIVPVYISNNPWLDKFHGLKSGMRYKYRVLDLIVNYQSFEAFKQMSETTKEIRQFLSEKGYREFNTGVLQKKFEAGQATAFQVVCKANGKPLYLSLTSELKLKRLIVAGYEKVYEIAQSFRNEGIDNLHSPEFTLLEIYGVSENYLSMVELTEEMVKRVMQKIKEEECQKDDSSISLATPFAKISFDEAFRKYVSKQECTLKTMVKLFPDMFHMNMTNFTWLMKVIEKLIVPQIQQPTFLTELPAGMSPFVKTIDGKKTERAFFIARGLFIADIYTDENDPVVVQKALEKQAQEAGFAVNQDYLEVIKMGLPKTAGIGMGLNRLFMAFIEKLRSNIKETILYPIT